MGKVLWRSLAATGAAAGGIGGLTAASTAGPAASMASSAAPAVPASAVPAVTDGQTLAAVGDVTPSFLGDIGAFASNAASAVVGALVAGRWLGPPAPAPKA